GEPVIEIRLGGRDGWLCFEIANTVAAIGNGCEDRAAGGLAGAEAAERIGMNNLRRQLSHLYGDKHELMVSTQDRWFRVRLTVPLNKDQTHYEKDKVLAGR